MSDRIDELSSIRVLRYDFGLIEDGTPEFIAAAEKRIESRIIVLATIAREAEAENAQLREALSNALIAMDGWGAEEDGIPSDFGAWDAYCEGARLLGWHVYQEQAAEGVE